MTTKWDALVVETLRTAGGEVKAMDIVDRALGRPHKSWTALALVLPSLAKRGVIIRTRHGFYKAK